MTDQPTNSGPDSTDPTFDPTAPPPPPVSPDVSAHPPQSDAPAYPQSTPAPAYGQPTPPPANPYGGSTPPPAANPYGYGQAPTMGAQGGGQVAVGSLPYVEHHFGPVANFGDRILPAIVDGLLGIVGLIPMIIGIVVMATSSSSGGYDDYGNYVPGEASGAGIGIGLLFMFLGFALAFGIWVWNRIFRMGRTGQSVGKKMFGLKLINSVTGEPIGPGQSFIRELIAGLANQIVYLSYLWMLWDPNRQTLGDLVVKSTVIKVPKA